MKSTIAILVMFAGSAYACPGNSDMYSPNPDDPNFNPLHPDADYDGDGIPNSEDPDDDNDGILDCEDPEVTPPTYPPGLEPPIWINCPPWLPCTPLPDRGTDCVSMAPACDTDGDGVTNDLDDDDDDDGVNDVNDPDHPDYDPTDPQSDPDCDGIPNSEDPDDDDDGVLDDDDPSPTCPPDEDPDPDPDPDPPEPPEPPEPPIRPDPPNPPDDRPPPDLPPDPDPPTDPRPPGGGDPIDPAPPGIDECCQAIIERLDVIVMWLNYSNDVLQQLNENAAGARDDMYGYMNDLMYDDRSYFKVIIAQGEYLSDYLQLYYLQNSDQTWYLQQLYEQFYVANGSLPNPPADLVGYSFGSSTTSLAGLGAAHDDSMSENLQDFRLPDITPYMEESVVAPSWDFEFVLPVTNHPMVFAVDFAPMTPLRDAAHFAILILAYIHGITIVVSVLRK